MYNNVYQIQEEFTMKKKTVRVISAVLLVCMLMSLAIPAFASSDGTSFSFRFDSKQKNVRNTYPDYKAIFDAEYSTTPVPGVERTKFGDGDVSTTMVPQGLCIAGNYLLVTAYDYEKVHNSVIYVMSNDDVKNRRLLSTVVLPDKNHVGGITFDGEYVWVARSTKKEIGAIKLSDFDEAAKHEVYSVNYYKKVKCLTTASFITYYDGKIWVGLYDADKAATLQGFELNKETMTLDLKCTAVVPKRCQGATFTERNGKTYLITSSSYGRNLSSYIRSYEFSYNGEKGDTSLVNEFTLPPMTEELEICGDHLLIMTEAPATEYSAASANCCINPMDRISAAKLDDIVSEEPVGFFARLWAKFIDFLGKLFGITC